MPEPKAGRGGVTSSKIGCLPVCYLKLNSTDKTIDDFVMRTDTGGPDLWLDTGNEPPEALVIRIGVTYARWLESDMSHITEIGGSLTGWSTTQFRAGRSTGTQQLGIGPVFSDQGYLVRVSDDKESCVIEDTSTSEIVYQGRRS